MPDLTLTYTDGVLKATLKAGADATHTAATVDTLKGAKYYYKAGASVTAPAVGSEFKESGFTAWDGEEEIVCATGNKVLIVEVVQGLNTSTVSRVSAKLDAVVGA